MDMNKKLFLLCLCGFQFFVGLYMLVPRVKPLHRFSTSKALNASMQNKYVSALPDRREMDKVLVYLDAKLHLEHALRYYIDAATITLLAFPLVVAIVILKRDRKKSEGSGQSKGVSAAF